jgi:hypothetical protein
VGFIDKRAISAGALISLATDEIVMTRGATIGAVTPVELKGGAMAPVEAKVVSYFRKEMKATAEANGRRGDVAGAMVRGVEWPWRSAGHGFGFASGTTAAAPAVGEAVDGRAVSSPLPADRLDLQADGAAALVAGRSIEDEGGGGRGWRFCGGCHAAGGHASAAVSEAPMAVMSGWRHVGLWPCRGRGRRQVERGRLQYLGL